MGDDDSSDCSESVGSFKLDRAMSVNLSESGCSDEKLTQVRIGARESRAVFLIRTAVFGVLFIATAVVSITLYYATSTAEIREFEGQFESNARKIADTFQLIVTEKVSALGTLSAAYTSRALSQRQPVEQFPYIMLDSFPHVAANALRLSGALFLTFAPRVEPTKEAAASWAKYAIANQASWKTETFEYQNSLPQEFGTGPIPTDFLSLPFIFQIQDYSTGEFSVAEIPSPDIGMHLPHWQAYPLGEFSSTNFDIIHNNSFFKTAAAASMHRGEITLAGLEGAQPGFVNSTDFATHAIAFMKSFDAGVSIKYEGEPFNTLFYPVFDTFDIPTRRPMGVISAVLDWATYLRGILPPGTADITVVLDDSCNTTNTFSVHGKDVNFVGKGTIISKKMSTYEISVPLIENGKEVSEQRIPFNQEHCPLILRVYPTMEFYEDHVTRQPLILTVSVFCIFLFTGGVFLLYNYLVEHRNSVVVQTAADSDAIVSNMFPKEFRDRLVEQRKTKVPQSGIQNFLESGVKDQDSTAAPLAELFLDTTVMFADVAGFTAWSSVRSPAQVFKLLETIYQAFDKIANRRKGVYKVETVGDCYVAVSGVPEPRRDHAVVMARYANECMRRMASLSTQLEVSLGPDTADLSLRIGLHSGPVIAGILRGDRARFQLFGDTVNTTSRIESTGIAKRIHLSDATAQLLAKDGKEHWTTPRNDAVMAKGKGMMKTHWLNVKRSHAMSEQSASVIDVDEFIECSKRQRLIDWNTDVLKGLLRQIVARRNSQPTTIGQKKTAATKSVEDSMSEIGGFDTVFEEVKEIIVLPTYDPFTSQRQQDPDSVVLSPKVEDQLRNYVDVMSGMYHGNAFHNFEHASHVTMSVTKLLSRIVAPQGSDSSSATSGSSIAAQMHDHTFGITSDPLTQFAVVFSALIHDADHPGVPNAQLIKEHDTMAVCYHNKSVAEQNSIDLAWQLLLNDSYADLRALICVTTEEWRRFRQLVVNVVLATDIVDAELKKLRNNRWAKAFNNGMSEKTTENEDQQQQVNRKATIVIEHLIQASDVSHTMQHWNVYRKWNERFFHECYQAFLDGRADVDPSLNWYKGEIGFFDFYIIPLAKKLKDCGVFGVSSDEYLQYAVTNRSEWEAKGQAVVEEMKMSIGESCSSLLLPLEKSETEEATETVDEGGDNKQKCEVADLPSLRNNTAAPKVNIPMAVVDGVKNGLKKTHRASKARNMKSTMAEL